MNATALSLPVILPEFILAFGVLVLILLGALRGERSVWLVTEGAVALLGVALVVLLVGDRPEGVTFYGAFTDDAFARFMKALALIGSLATLLLSIDFMRSHKIGGFEFPVLLLLGHARHDDADFGHRFHRAVPRPRTDEFRRSMSSPPIAVTTCAPPRPASNILCSARSPRACCCTAYR